MRLSELVASLDAATVVNFSSVNAQRVVCDSREVRPGDCFVAVDGVKADGHAFAADAVARGAVVLVGRRRMDVGVDVPQILVKDSRRTLPKLSHAVRGFPARGMKVVGITGTKGKTTTSYIARNILRSAGGKPGLIGTVAYDLVGRTIPAPLTTPDAAGLAAYFAEMKEAGADSAVMEVSSIALDQGRTGGIDFAAGVFTNLSGDHMDYHKTPENYLKAKSLLFAGLAGSAAAVLNADDPASVAIARKTKSSRIIWYSLSAPADVVASDIAIDRAGSRFTLTIAGKSATVHTPLVGAHNIANCLAAAGAAHGLGIGFDVIAHGLRTAPPVPGRLEPVPTGRDFSVLVDYAHTDDSLARVLSALRPLTAGRLIVVFGCGGDRDRTKRPRMAAAAEKGADLIFVTSDNPRTEDAGAILNEITTGFSPEGRAKATVDADRRGAIGAAIAAAGAGDVVLIAGKGHEDYQIIGTTKIHFDDREAAREFLGGGATKAAS